MGRNPYERTMRTDCEFCFGTGLCKPTPTETLPCPNGCRAHMWSLPKYMGRRHEQELLDVDGRVCWIDVGIGPTVEALWRAGIDTWTSCQGDEKRHGHVAITDPSRRTEALMVLRSLGWEVIDAFDRHLPSPPNGYFEFEPDFVIHLQPVAELQ